MVAGSTPAGRAFAFRRILPHHIAFTRTGIRFPVRPHQPQRAAAVARVRTASHRFASQMLPRCSALFGFRLMRRRVVCPRRPQPLLFPRRLARRSCALAASRIDADIIRQLRRFRCLRARQLSQALRGEDVFFPPTFGFFLGGGIAGGPHPRPPWWHLRSQRQGWKASRCTVKVFVAAFHGPIITPIRPGQGAGEPCCCPNRQASSELAFPGAFFTRRTANCVKPALRRFGDSKSGMRIRISSS